MAALFVDVLRVYTLAGKFRVREFVVMRDHIHLLITLGSDMSIEKAMQMIIGGFSYRAKKELRFSSEVWQRGFSDVRVKDETSFVAHRSYIYENPVRAGLVNRAEEHPYSSLHLRRSKAQGLKPTISTVAVIGTTEVVP